MRVFIVYEAFSRNHPWMLGVTDGVRRTSAAAMEPNHTTSSSLQPFRGLDVYVILT
jgi:hypothetical protein